MNCKRAFFLLVLFCFFAFCGCKNFLNGKEVLSEINQSVEYANASETTVVVTTNYGNVLNNGERKLKKGDTLQLNYSEGTSGYQFVKWDVEPAKSVSFVEAGGINLEAASVKIENTSQKITIKPVLYERPKIDTSKTLPAFVKSGVEKNSSIYFTFTKKLSPQNDFKRIRIEMVSSVEGQNTKLFGNEDSALDNFMLPTVDNYELTIAAKRDNYISLMNDVETIRVTIPADYYYEIDGYKICFGAEQSYSYIINNQTVEKLEVSVSCEGGTITPNTRTTFSVGNRFDIVYTKPEEYLYKDWSVTAGGYIVEKCPNDEKDIAGYYKAWLKSETGEKTGEPITFLSYNKPDDATRIILESQNMYKIEFTVLENLSGVSIKPDTILMPKISDYEPKYEIQGSFYDRKIEIYFNKNINEGTLIKENFIIKDNDTQKDYSEYFTISTTTVNGKTSTKLIPSYNIKNLFTAGKDHVDINIALSDSITDEDGYSITGTKSWYYRIINHAEEIKPVIDEIHFYSDSDPDAYFYRQLTQKPKAEWWSGWEYDEEFESTKLQFGDYSRNHVSKIYICIQGHDEGSGVGYLRVKEKQGNDVAIREYKFEGNLIDEENQIYEFKQLHELQINDGDVVVEISLIDKVGNESEVKKIDVIKETVQNKYSIALEIAIASEDYVTSTSFETIQAYINQHSTFTVMNYVIKTGDDSITSITSSNDDLLSQKFRTPLHSYYKIEAENDEGKTEICYGLFDYQETLLYILNNHLSVNNIDFNKLIFTFYSEAGVIDTIDFNIPSSPDKAQVIEDGNNYKFYPNVMEDEKAKVDEYYVFYYTGKDGYKFIKKNIDEIASLNTSGVNKKRNLYISRHIENNVLDFYSLPIELQFPDTSSGNNIEFPTLTIDDIHIDYPKNTSMTNITVNLKSLKIDGRQYLIKCRKTGMNSTTYFKDTQFSVESQKKYEICLSTLSGSRYVDSTIFTIDTTKEDNVPPVFVNDSRYDDEDFYKPDEDYTLHNLQCFAPNFYRITNSIADNKSPISKVHYIVPPIDNYSQKNMIYFKNLTGLSRMIDSEEDFEYAKKNWLHGFVDIENDCYYLPSFNNDLILYIEDENGNYSLAYTTSKITRNNSVPKIEYTDEKFVLGYPGGLPKSKKISIQNISINSNKWNTNQILLETNEINITNDNDFVRVFVNYGNNCFLVPLYFCPAKYKDGFVSKNHSWFKVENGYQVFTDAPTLCHTMFAPTKLTETNKTEDAYVWESTGMETGILVTDTMFTYSDDQTDEVPSGFYYATICHFADGTILMSDVKLKE